jgi:lysophospholipase L1-like esterase
MQRGDGTQALATSDIRLPYQTVLAEKPHSALRILTFGGSATAGLGYGPNVTFTRHLERLLERAHPDRTVEVVNLGVVALASKQVRVLVEDAIRHHQPDAVVVYSGNNEFLEVHAEKFAASQSTLVSRALAWLNDTNAYRLASRAVHGPPQKPSLAEQDFSRDDLRVSQHAIIKHIEMTPDEILTVIDRYEENVDAIAQIAKESGTPLMLMTVAANWRYRGREDLPADWLDGLLGEPGPQSPDRYREALAKLERDIETGDPMARWEALYRRAAGEEALGDLESASESYRLAMNEDPHLRRALDAMAERVRRIGERHDVPVFDTIPFLVSVSSDGIIGFDLFYDYVHFTPWGALWMGARLFDELEAAGYVPNSEPGLAGRYVEERLARLETLEVDALDRGEWMGIGFDRSAISDRDLWKYERMVASLDQRIVDDPADVRALIYRGNARAVTLRGSDGAEQDYRAALQLSPENSAIVDNLSWLENERPRP